MKISLQQLLMLGIFWSVCFQLNVDSVWCQCLQDQQSLLLQLKQNLTFEPALSFKLVFWNSSTDCCSWFGVTCDSGGHVIGLDLSNESLSDGIGSSSSLFNILHLQSLDLSLNTFYDVAIPPGFGKLANLHYLNLSNSHFTGRILPDISGLTRLTELDLSGTDLWAEGNRWCQALSSLTSLRVLDLASCNLSGPIDSSLAKLRSIEVITMSGNNISGPVPDFLGSFSNLTSLDLKSCSLYGNFPGKIFQLPFLQDLDISGNDYLQGSIPEFPENGSLQTLLLSVTKLGGHLPKSIGNLGRLSRLELQSCNFSGSIPDTIAKLAHLVSLDFSYNNFSGPIPSFSSAKHLTQLSLAVNQLTGSILSTDWSGLSKLESLDLRRNLLNGTIPASLFGIPSLRIIDLNENQFTGKLNGPSRLFSSALLDLDLRGSKLEGPFPDFIFQLRSLTSLKLSSNSFSGPVYLRSFQQLKNLSALDLSYNRLWVDQTGVDPASFPNITTIYLASCNLTRFPDYLKKLSSLYNLDIDLSDNKISGEIPDWIWRLEDLRFLNLSRNFLVNFQHPPEVYPSRLVGLDLSNNRLQGELPNPLPSVGHLDFSSNNFSSVIPADFDSYLGKAYIVSLANNNLHGSIPRSICNATSLIVLDLSNTSLIGTIPQCLFGMESLAVLNLRGNSLSGSISDTFPRNCVAQLIDLNGNRLEGRIPRSLASCTALQVLDLGNNQINDVFPSHLKEVSSLRVLVLRSNRLQGPIRCSSGSFSWQMLHIVDLASNNFSGDLPNQCLRTWKAMMMYDKDEVRDVKVLTTGSLYYQAAATVTMKNQELPLVKILYAFTSIDVSCNKLEGVIPEAIGEFKALRILNLSQNALTGSIPSSIGNVGQIESLDLSSNHLTGNIPQEMAQLNFLAVLNLSNNHLVGRIPTGKQFHTFANDSYQGNDGLCGLPLTKTCGVNVQPEDENSDDGIEIKWNPLSVLLGFAFGLGMVILPLFWERWRTWCNKHVDVLISKLFPQMNQRSRNRGSRTSRT